MGSKILVTGSNGLVGSSLKNILGESHVFHTKDDVDLTNYSKTKDYINFHIKNSGIDTIIHCAAKVGGVLANSNDNKGFFNTNYQINNSIIKSCLEFEIPNFVNLLSTCIFPDKNITYPLTPSQIDNGAPHPSNYGYSYSKRLSGYETKTIKKLTGLNWINVVPTNVYGINDNFNLENSHMIPGLIHRAYLSKQNKNKFTIWGDGSSLRQFIHADDLSRNILWSIDNWKSDDYFMAINETEYSVIDVVKIISEKLEIPFEDLVFDTSKPSGQFRKPAKTDIPHDYKFIELKKGINDTVDWFIENYNTLRK